MQRLLPAAQSSEAEAETALELPGRSAITTPDEGTTAGIDGDGVVVEVEGGVVEAEFDQCSVGIAAVDAPAFGLAGVEEGHLLAVTAEAPVGSPANAQGRKEEGAFTIADGMGEFHGEFRADLVHFHFMETESVLAIGTAFAEFVEAGVGVADEGLRFDQPVAPGL